MSFRALPTNPILQRLRKVSINGVEQSQVSVLSVTSLEEPHTISDYGCLSAPHSFAHEPHEIRRRNRRRSSAARQPQTESHGVTTQDDGKERKISLMPALIPKSSTAEIEGPTSTASSISQHINAPVITGRPRESAPAEDDCVDAVILKAKWESFTRAPARKIQVSQRKKKL